MESVSFIFHTRQLQARNYCLLLALLLLPLSATFAQPEANKPTRKVMVNGKIVRHIERIPNEAESAQSCTRQEFRSIDGTCNNLSSPEANNWGAADVALFREMSSAYGAPDFINELGGNCRLSPRAISNLVVAQNGDIPSPRDLSSLVFTWGQFLDHDIDLTPEGHTEYVPILLPANEPLFTSPIPFLRSEVYAGSGVSSPREQQNIITAWIDGSQIYGSEQSRADWLRTFREGKLKVSAGNFLPYNTVDGELFTPIDPNAPSMAGDGGGTEKVFVAGDVRANEQPGLTSLHTLFVREHNRLCDELIASGITNDEEIYQRVRKMVGAQLQAITYLEFLPALGIRLNNYAGYQEDVIPDITNLFATAAYRLGHTMVTDEIPLINDNCEDIDGGSLALLEGFFNPDVVREYGIEAILHGLATQTQQKVDAKIVDNLRNFLFPTAGGDPFGLDLASLNIQRGRDHGLPDYNAVRAHYLGEGVDQFSDITSDEDLQAALEAAYGHVYDMDLWVGLLSEDPMPNSSVGPTLNAILGKQFEALRDGDYYYYLNDPDFRRRDRDRISNTSFQDIIQRNTTINALQNEVFFAANCSTNGGGTGNPPFPPNRNGRLQGEVLPNNNLILAPNPTNGKVAMQFQTEIAIGEASLEVRQIDGKVVYQQTIQVESEIFFQELDVSEWASGTYFISLKLQQEVYTQKLVVE